MSQRFSGSVGAIVLGLIAVNAACGSRDNLFVAADEATGGVGVGGSLYYAGTGNVNSGGRVGVSNGGAGAHAGVAGFASGAVAGVGVGVAGTVGAGGGTQAFGGSTGVGAVGNVDGGSMDWCTACLNQNATDQNQCAVARCNFQTTLCDLVPVDEGASCAGGDLCSVSICHRGACVPIAAVACPSSGTPCMVATCDPLQGTCVDQPATGGACDDGDPCTSLAQCVMGKCVPGAPLSICQNNDKCCPANCNSNTDNDCPRPPPTAIETSDRGWYEISGFHDPGNKNTFTGFSPPNRYNSFFVFDLSAITRPIVSAQIEFVQEAYYGMDSSEVISIWDVSTNTDVLSSTSQSPAIFQDLQSGVQYTNITGSPTATGATLVAYLTGPAIDDLNAARGHKFAVGLHVDTLSSQMQADEGMRFSEQDEPRENRLLLSFQ